MGAQSHHLISDTDYDIISVVLPLSAKIGCQDNSFWEPSRYTEIPPDLY